MTKNEIYNGSRHRDKHRHVTGLCDRHLAWLERRNVFLCLCRRTHAPTTRNSDICNASGFLPDKCRPHPVCRPTLNAPSPPPPSLIHLVTTPPIKVAAGVGRESSVRGPRGEGRGVEGAGGKRNRRVGAVGGEIRNGSVVDTQTVKQAHKHTQTHRKGNKQKTLPPPPSRQKKTPNISITLISNLHPKRVTGKTRRDA